MKKIIISFVSLILAALLLTSILSITASAVVINDPLTFSVGSASGKPGDKVKIPVSITGNPGLWSFRFIIYYEPAIQITDVIVGDTFDSDEMIYSNPNSYLSYIDAVTYLFKESNIETSGYNGMVFTLNDNNLNNNTGNGTIIILEMQIPDNLPNGSYALNILNDDESAINLDADYNPNSFTSITAMPGSITISGSTADKMPETTAPDKVTEAPSASTQASGSTTPQTQIVYAPVTDASGAVVTDSDGNTVTTALEVLLSNETGSSGKQTTAAADNESSDASSTMAVKANGAQNDISGIKKVLFIIVIAALVLLLIGAAIAFRIINKNAKKKKPHGKYHTSRMTSEELNALNGEQQNTPSSDTAKSDGNVDTAEANTDDNTDTAEVNTDDNADTAEANTDDNTDTTETKTDDSSDEDGKSE